MRDRCAKRKSLNFLLTQEETYWRQRSRISWMKEGDRNTRYFHAFATQRKQKNRISCLLNRHGNWVTQEDELGNLAKDFFKNLFNTSNPASTDQVVDLIDRFITEDMNQWLLREFDASEVRDALFQIPPTKALGPDGMSAIFFQTYWHIVGNDFTLAFLDFLNSGCMLRSVNFTQIALIPKTKLPESMGQFRPIALCNVIYKTISKVLANRLKVILPSIISDSQSTFVPGRLITDNIMVAFETLHYMKTKRQGKTTHMAAKLDMSKAYDHIEWCYLETLMLKMGFHFNWVQIIMQCVSTVSYYVLLHGKPTDLITPERGIRQGDPLSPYLFLLCAEGLSTLLRKSEVDHKLCGVVVCRGGPR
jgi:hypothetical protein